MNIAKSNFLKHGHTSFDVWLDNGQTMCAAFLTEDEVVTVGFLQKKLLQELEWDSNKAAILQDNPYFLRIYDVRIIKSGWFAMATVDFTVPLGQVMRGKTDKGFAEFLVSIVDQIDQRLPSQYRRG